MESQTAPSSILPSLPGASFVSSLFSSTTTESFPAANPESSASQAEQQSAATLTPSMSGWLKRPALLKSSLRTNSDLERPSSHSKSVDFLPADVRESTSDEDLREGSFVSGTSDVQKRKKRTQRPKTSFSLCHPPRRNGSKHKIKIRARPLLQLHKLEPQSRPKPAFEVLPSAIFSPKLSKAIAKVFGAKHGLCPSDLAIVAAEEYHKHEDADVDESKDVLALICGAGRKETSSAGRVKIAFADGSEWDAHQLSNGSYEFRTVDDHGLKQTVRWVQKKTQQRGSADATESESLATETKKFNFSTISSNTRRHPIIANLTSTSLDISDSYTLPAPSDRLSVTDLLDESSSEAIITTDQLRNIITATAVWVAVREGWCPSFRSDDSVCRSPSFKSATTSRSYATPPGSPGKPPAAIDGALCDNNNIRRSGSLRQTFARAPSLLRRQAKADDRPLSSQSAHSMPTLNLENSATDPSPVRRRPRADTTSTVVVHGSGNGQWRPDIDEGMNEVDGEDDSASEKDSVDGENDADFDHEDETPPMAGAIDAAELRRRRVESHARPDLEKRNVSHGTSSGSSDGMLEQEKMTARARHGKRGKKKGGFLRRLFCGMI